MFVYTCAFEAVATVATVNKDLTICPPLSKKGFPVYVMNICQYLNNLVYIFYEPYD